MTDDEARQARLDALIADMESTIATARNTAARMDDYFRSLGIDNTAMIEEILRSSQTSPEMRTMIDDDMRLLEQELAEGEKGELVQSSARRGGKKRKPRRMTRI